MPVSNTIESTLTYNTFKDILRIYAPPKDVYPDQTLIVTCYRHSENKGEYTPQMLLNSPRELLKQLYPSATVIEDTCGCAVALPEKPSPAVTKILREQLNNMASVYDAKQKKQQDCIKGLLTKYWT